MKKIVLIHRNYLSMLIAALISLTLGNQLSAQCDFTMACNDNVQLSLGDDCTELVTPDIILENPDFSDDNYLVQVFDEFGVEIPGAIVNGSHIGMTLQTQITLTFNDCGLTCWGTISIEDKLPPIVNCVSDTVVDCGEILDPEFLGGITIDSTYDCSGVDSIYYHDVSSVMPCDDEFSEIITRTWSAIDVYGNEFNCVQTISIMSAVIDSVVLPEDFIVDCELLGIPIDELTLEDTGKPTLIECANIQYFYNDLEFDLCGDGIKIRREWHVLDWCTGRDTVGYQTIKVEDTQAPVVECGTTNYTVDSNIDACYATFEVPLPDFDPTPDSDPLAPKVLYDCSTVNFTISYAPFPEGFVCESLEDAADVLAEENLVLDFIEVEPNEDGKYIIEALPLGCNWIKYVFYDGCGHETECTKDIFVIDAAPPAAICEGYTVVTVDHSGWGNLMATSLDDHSWDDCGGELFFTARRLDSECTELPDINPDDENFDEYLHFCCEDVGEYIHVELRVEDEAGNSNICQAYVYVDDKVSPAVSCPEPVVQIDCEEDYRDLDLTGEPTYFDNCGADIEQVYTEFLNECGIGYVLVDHIVSDNADNTIICQQRINVVNEHLLEHYDIEWPDDMDTNSCGELDLSPESLGSLPDMDYETSCTNIGLTWDDLTFYDTEDACYKIIRTWTIVDWCAEPLDYYTHVQKILIYNDVGPEFLNCDDVFYPVNENCEALVNLNLDIEDDCTPKDKLDINWTLDIDSDGSTQYTGNSPLVSGLLPVGDHNLTVTAEDECGNVTECSFDIIVEDDSDPTPVCLTEVVWVLDEDGEAEVWASDFDFKSFDGCAGGEDLVFAFDEEGEVLSLEFDCDDIDNGISQEIFLQMYVIDEDENTDFCNVILILQDNFLNACDDDPSTLPRIEGTIYNSSMAGLPDIDVELHNLSNEEEREMLTIDDGGFMFDALPMHHEYMIKPTREGNYLDGVSTLDLVLIQKHILGQAELDSPYKLIAADVNKSESITGIDLVELRKLILGIYDELPDHDSWDFVSMTQGVVETYNPWNYINQIGFNQLEEDQAGVDFVAVKIGDVNGSIGNNSNGGFAESRSAHNSYLEFESKSIESDKIYEIQYQQSENSLVNGFQISFDLNPNVKLLDITSKIESFGRNNWKQVGNEVIISWSNTTDPSFLEFSLQVEASIVIPSTELIRLTENKHSEAYDLNDQVNELELRSLASQAIIASLEQNKPNPFTDFTDVELFIPESKRADFIIQDFSGKIVYEKKNIEGSGLQVIRIDNQVLSSGSGVYLYSLKTNQIMLTKKMFFVK